jgi:hypothetical protein
LEYLREALAYVAGFFLHAPGRIALGRDAERHNPQRIGFVKETEIGYTAASKLH